MQYLVKVSGAVLGTECKTYLIDSENESSAKEIASQQFSDEFSACGQIVCAQPQKRKSRAIWAIVLMLIACLLSIPRWAAPNTRDLLLIRPDLTSCLYSVFLYAAFIVRFKGIQRTVSSIWDILLCVVCIFLLASFIQVFLNTKNISLFGLDAKTILPITFLLSALGMKLVSLVCMGAITLLSLLNIGALNDAMGFWGVVYIILAFVGMLIYFSVEPAINETFTQVKFSFAKGTSRLKYDINQAKISLTNLTAKKDAAVEKINTAEKE